jgi:hypothetical protein
MTTGRRVHVHLRVNDLFALSLGGLDHLRVAVASGHHGDAHHEVEPFAAVCAVHPTPGSVVDGHRRDVGDDPGDETLFVIAHGRTSSGLGDEAARDHLQRRPE